MLKNVQPPYSLKMATLIYTIYINLTWGRIKPEEVPIKTTRTFSKAWNAGNCPSNNQRQHDTLSEEGNVLEITDRYTYNKQFLFSWQIVNIGLSFLFFFHMQKSLYVPQLVSFEKFLRWRDVLYTFTSQKPISVSVDNVSMI